MRDLSFEMFLFFKALRGMISFAAKISLQKRIAAKISPSFSWSILLRIKIHFSGGIFA